MLVPFLEPKGVFLAVEVEIRGRAGGFRAQRFLGFVLRDLRNALVLVDLREQILELLVDQPVAGVLAQSEDLEINVLI